MDQPLLDLDALYKTRIGESHEAGLQAVYDYALTKAAQAFIAPLPVETPPAEQTPEGA